MSWPSAFAAVMSGASGSSLATLLGDFVGEDEQPTRRRAAAIAAMTADPTLRFRVIAGMLRCI
jgi:hypothetical protein